MAVFYRKQLFYFWERENQSTNNKNDKNKVANKNN